MLSGNLPFNFKNKDNKKPCNSLNNNMKSKNNSYLQNQIINEKPKDIDNISEEAKNLLKGLLNKNPLKRLTCEEILNHPWLKEEVDNLYAEIEEHGLDHVYSGFFPGCDRFLAYPRKIDLLAVINRMRRVEYITNS